MATKLNSYIHIALIGLSTLGPAVALGATPSFNAELTVGKESRFLLLDAAGRPSPWLKIGDTYDGYQVAAYDALAGVLEVTKDGATAQLKLAADAAVGAATTPMPATIADATSVLDSMRFEKMLDKTIAGAKQQQLAMLNRMLSQAVKPATDRAAVAAFQQKVVDEITSALTSGDIKGDVAKAYSQVFTKDELSALADFYSSPAGQSFADKQPALAQKMNELMMPRLMVVIPKVQQMAQQFVSSQKTAAAGDTSGGTAVAAAGVKP